QVRTVGGQLGLHPLDELEQVFLIARREGERTNRVVHGSERLVYFVELLLVHANYCGPNRAGRASAENADAPTLQCSANDKLLGSGRRLVPRGRGRISSPPRSGGQVL